jgi:hypothetical protein
VAVEVRLQVIQQEVSLVAVAVQIKAAVRQLIQQCPVVVEPHLRVEQKLHHVHQMVRNTRVVPHVVLVLKAVAVAVAVTSVAVAVIQVAKQMVAAVAAPDS